MMRLLAASALATVACSSAPKQSPDPATTTVMAPQVRMQISRGETFRPAMGDSALAAFRPEVASFDSGGICNVAKPFGPGVTVVTASFPSNDSTIKNAVTLTFDSVGQLVRFSDRRGLVRFRPPPGATPEQFDSVRRVSEAAMRSTSVNFDYPINQALASNSGGGKPTVAVIGSIRAMENLEKLGPPTARIQRVRKLCGV
jgi:hypothetical protein